MPKITKAQYIERWDALPPVLREAMFSPANGELIWKIGEEHHLKEEQIATIAGICGNIVMGFIHLEDLAKEIKTSVGIDERLAEAISREIDRKVFSPLRSEIEKVYSPAGPVVEEIISPVEAELRGTEKEIEIEARGKEEITGEHKIDISEFKVISPEAEPPVPPAFAEKPKEMEVEEVELAILPKMEASPVEAEKPTEEAKPIIIHEEAEIKAAREPARSFSLGSVFGFFKKKETKSTEPPTTAEIEMEMPEEPTKVVDYEYTEPTPPDNLGVQSIEQPPAVQEQLPAPENLPIEEKPDAAAPTTFGVGVPTPPPADVGKEKGGNVIDLSNFEKKE